MIWVPREGTTPDGITGLLLAGAHSPVAHPALVPNSSLGQVCTAQNPAGGGSTSPGESTAPASKAAHPLERHWLPPGQVAVPAEPRAPTRGHRALWLVMGGRTRSGERHRHSGGEQGKAWSDGAGERSQARAAGWQHSWLSPGSRNPLGAGSQAAEQRDGSGGSRAQVSRRGELGVAPTLTPWSSRMSRHRTGGSLWPVQRLFVQANPLGVY